MKLTRDFEHEILGCRFRLQPDQQDTNLAQMVTELVREEVLKLKNARPNLKDTDIAVLAALEVARQKIEIEQEYKQSILELEATLNSADS